jgi:hypothetical protein
MPTASAVMHRMITAVDVRARIPPPDVAGNASGWGEPAFDHER